MKPAPVQRLSLADEQRIDAVCARFEAALRNGEDARVESYVDAVEPALRARLREELVALRGEFADLSPRPPLPGRKLGGYRILHKIGEGGMGTVFEAMQEATRRRVALKVVRSDLGSERVRRRFEREARVLAHLHHPGIAQIFDAGVDEAADSARPTPYLVMELLRGLTLLAHADEYQLGVRDRLELVRRICGAVQHAHDQGIVHRDLKPANIIVVEGGSSDPSRSGTGGVPLGTPKVLDFGVARMFEHDDERSLETQTGQIVGTMAYMSPEQLSGDAAQLDGRADVYALGVILYQLLTGKLPHDLVGLTLPAAIDALCHARPAPLGTLEPRLRGDVEIIVGKALEKRPADRYRSAAALAADLQRHLDDVPIEARPPDAIDRIAKFARRNRGLFGGIVTAAAVLLVSLVVVSVFAFQQTCLRAAAEAARTEAEAAHAETAAAHAEADRRQRTASAVSDFLEDMLRSGEAEKTAISRDTTIYEVLVAAIAKVDGSFPSDPQSRAAVRMALGASFLSQADFDLAERQFVAARRDYREELPEVSLEVAEATSQIARVMEETGRFDEAERGYRAALEMLRELTSGAAALPSDTAQADPDARATNAASDAMNNLAGLFERQGDYARALEMRREILVADEIRAGPGSPRHARNLNHLASIHEQLGDYDEAERGYREALEIRRKVLPNPHPHTANVLNNLGILCSYLHRSEEAATLLDEALDMRLALFDADHPVIATTEASLAAILQQAGRNADSLSLYRRAHESLIRRLGRDHADVHSIAVNMASVVQATGDFAAAKQLIEPAVDRFDQLHGAAHPVTLWATAQLARLERELGNLQRSVELYERCVKHSSESLGEHWRVGLYLTDLAVSQRRSGDGAAAIESYRRGIAILERTSGVGDHWTVLARCMFAEDLERLGRNEESLRVLDEIEPHIRALGEQGSRQRTIATAVRARLAQPVESR